MLFSKKVKRRAYDYEQVLRKLIFHLETLDHGAQNEMEILRTLVKVLDVESGSLFHFERATGVFLLNQWVGERPLNVSVSGEYEFLNYLRQSSNIVTKDEIVREQRHLDVRSGGIHYFTQLSCVAVIPLLHKGQWVGLLNVGRRLDRKEFDQADKGFLLILGYWLAHSMANALLFQEVQEHNRKLASLTRLKNEFMANITHELATPLNGILGLTDLILDGSDGPLHEDQRRHLQMIKSGGESLMEIVNNILSLLKVESSKKDIQVKKVDLSSLLTEVTGLFEGVLSGGEVRLVSRIRDSSFVYGDEEQIRTVLMNLIGNAVKFTSKGQIEVFADRSGDRLKVCIKDTGLGISEDNQTEIFGKFNQADGSLTRSHGGGGLGLTLVKKIVELHGGRVWVDSVLGKGSEFYFTLPVKPVGLMEARVG